MATRTGTQHLEVVDRYYWIPQVGTVAVFADVGGADVVEAFTRGGHTVMAVATTLGTNILVIEVRRDPTSRTMTIITLRGSWQVI